MNDEKKLEAAGLALQAVMQQREQALNQVIDLRVELTLVQAELAQHRAAQEIKKPVEEAKTKAKG